MQMKHFNKFILMFLVSVGSFLLLASIDEYENVVAPFFKKGIEKEKTIVPTKPKEELRRFIQDFNAHLSQAYLSSDPFFVDDLPAIEAVKKGIHDEIDFLSKSGKIMNISVGETSVEDVERLSSLVVRVKTMEVVSVSYLSTEDRNMVLPRQNFQYKVVYTIERMRGKWVVLGFEVVEARLRNEP